MAARLGISLPTLAAWEEREPAFAAACARAHDLAQAWWEDVAQAGVTERAFNSHLWLRVVAARFRGTYAQSVDFPGNFEVHIRRLGSAEPAGSEPSGGAASPEAATVERVAGEAGSGKPPGNHQSTVEIVCRRPEADGPDPEAG